MSAWRDAIGRWLRQRTGGAGELRGHSVRCDASSAATASSTGAGSGPGPPASRASRPACRRTGLPSQPGRAAVRAAARGWPSVRPRRRPPAPRADRARPARRQRRRAGQRRGPASAACAAGTGSTVPAGPTARPAWHPATLKRRSMGRPSPRRLTEHGGAPVLGRSRPPASSRTHWHWPLARTKAMAPSPHSVGPAVDHGDALEGGKRGEPQLEPMQDGDEAGLRRVEACGARPEATIALARCEASSSVRGTMASGRDSGDQGRGRLRTTATAWRHDGLPQAATWVFDEDGAGDGPPGGQIVLGQPQQHLVDVVAGPEPAHRRGSRPRTRRGR